MYCTGEGYNVLLYYVLYKRGIQCVDILCTVQERDTAVIYYGLYRRGIQRAYILCTVQERDTTC